MKLLEIPGELKKQYDYLISPIESRGIGTRDGEMAIDALVKANRVDLIENVLRGFSPSGRVYAALAMLKLSQDNQLVLSPDTLGTISKIRNLNIAIWRVRGCIASYTTANEILNEAEEPQPQLPQTEQSFAPMLSTTNNPSVKEGGP